MTLHGEAQRLLDFWFGSEPDDGAVAKQKSDLWWSGSPAVDGEIRARFGDIFDTWEREQLGWSGSPRGMLAMVLLMDQLPRSLYRGTPRAFESDWMARHICRDALMQGDDLQLRPIERVFLFLPLEHSEAITDQEDSVRLFSGLAGAAAPEVTELFAGYLRYAERHREIVARFGRFPHRNRILGRESTPDEVAFLQTQGSSF